jgi:hypothetical protein
MIDKKKIARVGGAGFTLYTWSIGAFWEWRIAVLLFLGTF